MADNARIGSAWIGPSLVLAAILHAGPGRAVQAGAGEGPADVRPAPQRWAADGADAAGAGGVPGFTRHVQPLLGKLGCSNRACHGSFQGQNGFRLSLFGSDPRSDYDELVRERREDGDGTRVDLDRPEASPVLLKPASEFEHGGGQRFRAGDWQYRMLRAWIAAGAPYEPGREAVVERLTVAPAEAVLTPPGDTAGNTAGDTAGNTAGDTAGNTAGRATAIRVVADYSDGTREDVTALTQFSSNDDAVAAVSDAGEVTAVRPGDTAVVVTYGGSVATVPVLVPLPGAGGRAIAFPAHGPIDEFVAAKLKKLGVVPSGLCTDEEFLRRVSLDVTGTLPTPQEITAFLADDAPDKRTRKVDELLERPAYAAWWATKLCDLTGLNAPLYLGSTDFGPMLGDQWHRWIERRVRENTPYDELVAGIVLGTSREPGESYGDYALRQSAYVRKADPLDFTAQDEMPHFWFRKNIAEPEDKALAFAYTFLGVRLDCAQCHRHPFDRWTQDDFRQFAALFGRVRTGIAPDAVEANRRLKEEIGLAKETAAVRRQGYWRIAREGRPVPWPEVYAGAYEDGETPAVGRLLGGDVVDLTKVADPRAALMDWLRRRDNPYFARALVNRVWAHYFGRGLVDPPDDHNLGNPPSHPALLDWLSQAFIEHGYDMKWLHREITRSRTYQLTWRPNETNRDDQRNLSHAPIRRLPAEVAVDALRQATAGGRALARTATDVTGRRIGVQATADERRTEFALVVFGKPLRTVNCDCERVDEPSLLQSLYLRNDKDVLALLDRPDGWLKEVAALKGQEADADALIREAYLRTLSRSPDETELARCRRVLADAADPADGLRDLLWALLNTQEFITNH